MIPKFRCFIDGIGIVGVKAIYFDSEQIILEPFNGVENQYIPLEEVELLQSTGLKDKNGVEIFEGDVVNREKGLGIPHEIIFKNCEFKLVTTHSEESLGKTRKGGLIIVGNKFEHPHLLEE